MVSGHSSTQVTAAKSPSFPVRSLQIAPDLSSSFSSFPLFLFSYPLLLPFSPVQGGLLVGLDRGEPADGFTQTCSRPVRLHTDTSNGRFLRGAPLRKWRFLTVRGVEGTLASPLFLLLLCQRLTCSRPIQPHRALLCLARQRDISLGLRGPGSGLEGRRGRSFPPVSEPRKRWRHLSLPPCLAWGP